MTRPFALAVGLVAIAAVTGCGAATSNQGAADGSVMAPDGQSAATPICSNTQILASNYNQSCTVDIDCRAIIEGNACTPCAFEACFATAAINAGSLSQYTSDIASTPAVLGPAGGGCPACESTVSLPGNLGPFCCGGLCHYGSFCSDAGLDSECEAAGGQCVFSSCANASSLGCGAGGICCLTKLADAATDAPDDAGANAAPDVGPADDE